THRAFGTIDISGLGTTTAIVPTYYQKAELTQRLACCGVFDSHSDVYSQLICAYDIAGRTMPMQGGLSGDGTSGWNIPIMVFDGCHRLMPPPAPADDPALPWAPFRVYLGGSYLCAMNDRRATTDLHDVGDFVDAPNICYWDGCYLRAVSAAFGDVCMSLDWAETNATTHDGVLCAVGKNNAPMWLDESASPSPAWTYIVVPSTNPGAIQMGDIYRMRWLDGRLYIAGHFGIEGTATGLVSVASTGLTSAEWVPENATGFGVSVDAGYAKDLLVFDIGAGPQLFVCGQPIIGGASEVPVATRSPAGVWSAVGSNITGDANQIDIRMDGSDYHIYIVGVLVVTVDSVPITCSYAHYSSATGEWEPWGDASISGIDKVTALACTTQAGYPIVIAASPGTVRNDSLSAWIGAAGVAQRPTDGDWQVMPRGSTNGLVNYIRAFDRYYPTS
ncbi:MAG: hypothetical protein ABFE01_04185, partial [Phycisphaerales bacterium]